MCFFTVRGFHAAIGDGKGNQRKIIISNERKKRVGLGWWVERVTVEGREDKGES
jgi:hypothetical protein